MKHPFEAGNAIFQSNISLLQRLMNTISPAPINLDLYFHKMHKSDKDPKSKASYRGGEMFERNKITCPQKEWWLNGSNLTSFSNWKLVLSSTFTCFVMQSRATGCLLKYLFV